MVIAWIDLETSGLLDSDPFILEAACVITDDSLNEIDGAEWVVNAFDTEEELDQFDMAPEVVSMHRGNGLFDDVLGKHSVSSGVVSSSLIQLIHAHTDPDGGLPYLGGSGVHFDRAVLGREMPAVLSCLHYRNVDVSVLRTMAEMFTPGLMGAMDGWMEAKGFGERTPHRAMPDVKRAIEQMRFFRETVFASAF